MTLVDKQAIQIKVEEKYDYEGFFNKYAIITLTGPFLNLKLLTFALMKSY